MAENPDRRDALKPLALGGTGLMLGIPLVMTQPLALEATHVSPLATLAQEWDMVAFSFSDSKAVLIRIPKPETDETRILQVQSNPPIFLAAYQLVCTHEGCTPALPNREHHMVCPCHQSTYRAADGSVVAGPARLPLRGISLEIRAGEVWATGFVE